MDYFMWPPPDRSDEMEYAYWNGDMEWGWERDEEHDRKQKSVPQENKTDDEVPF